MGAAALPELSVFMAPAHWRAIDLVSDLHLAPATARTVDAFAAHLAHTDADAVLILGDLFEVWIGDDTRGEGFARACLDLLHGASHRLWIGFMAGNRDFLVGPAMLADCGLHRLHDPMALKAFGRAWLLTHGDALCLDDVDYQAFRRQVRTREWQHSFLALPIPERERLACAIRSESQARGRAAAAGGVWADVDVASALAWLQSSGCGAMIHGHTHRPGSSALGERHVRHVLSDWDLDASPPRAEVLRLDAEGLHRRAPAQAR